MSPAFALVLVCAALDWFAVARHSKSLEYIFKPATMVALMLVTFWLTTWAPHDAWQARWFLLSFAFCLAGDVFLMLPNPRLFLLGLGAFLLAHIFYVVGLNPTAPPASAWVLLVPCALAVGAVEWRILSALGRANRTSLRAPVLVYGIAMMLMLFSAWATLFRPEWDALRRALVIGGAALFFVSDTMLAWNRFVKPFAAAPLGVIITYHLGQIALAASIFTG